METMKHARGIALVGMLGLATIAIAQTPKIDSMLIITRTVTRTVWHPPFVEPVRVDTLAVWTDTTVYLHDSGK
jgi:hypothetical protein